MICTNWAEIGSHGIDEGGITGIICQVGKGCCVVNLCDSEEALDWTQSLNEIIIESQPTVK